MFFNHRSRSFFIVVLLAIIIGISRKEGLGNFGAAKQYINNTIGRFDISGGGPPEKEKKERQKQKTAGKKPRNARKKQLKKQGMTNQKKSR